MAKHAYIDSTTGLVIANGGKIAASADCCCGGTPGCDYTGDILVTFNDIVGCDPCLVTSYPTPIYLYNIASLLNGNSFIVPLYQNTSSLRTWKYSSGGVNIFLRINCLVPDWFLQATGTNSPVYPYPQTYNFSKCVLGKNTIERTVSNDLNDSGNCCSYVSSFGCVGEPNKLQLAYSGSATVELYV